MDDADDLAALDHQKVGDFVADRLQRLGHQRVGLDHARAARHHRFDRRVEAEILAQVTAQVAVGDEAGQRAVGGEHADAAKTLRRHLDDRLRQRRADDDARDRRRPCA